MKLTNSDTPKACEHVSTERLGSAYNALFLRCQACGRVFVLQEGRLWSVPASKPAKQQIKAGSRPS